MQVMDWIIYQNCKFLQIKDIVASLFELWKLMDSPVEERNKFSRIIFVLRTSEAEIKDLGVLSTEMIEQVLILSYYYNSTVSFVILD